MYVSEPGVHHIMGVLEWECTVCLCPIKSSRKLVSYPLRTQNENENEILKNEVKHMCNERSQPPEANGTMFLFGPEFTRGRVC